MIWLRLSLDEMYFPLPFIKNAGSRKFALQPEIASQGEGSYLPRHQRKPSHKTSYFIPELYELINVEPEGQK